MRFGDLNGDLSCDFDGDFQSGDFDAELQSGNL
jgi:hypothetical protein